MKNYILIIILLFISCKKENNRIEFVKSKAINNLCLIKNPPKNASLLKKEIIYFLTKNSQKINYSFSIDFYKYTEDTEYFLDHFEDNGGPTSSHFLDNYRDKDGIAIFKILKCKNDSSKLVGKLRFYNNFYEPDTLLYKCNCKD